MHGVISLEGATSYDTHFFADQSTAPWFVYERRTGEILHPELWEYRQSQYTWVSLQGTEIPFFVVIYVCTCPLKTQHFSDVLSCGLSKAVQDCAIYIYYLGHMQRFWKKKINSSDSIKHDVKSASKLRYWHFEYILKDKETSSKSFLFASSSTVISPQLWQLWHNIWHYTNAKYVTM